MIKINNKEIELIISGEIAASDLAMKLVRENSSYDIAIAFVEELLAKSVLEPVEKVVITQDQLQQFFRVKQPQERRGRPRKENKED